MTWNDAANFLDWQGDQKQVFIHERTFHILNMRNIVIKLTDEEYRKIEEDARSQGFVLLSDYIKFRLLTNSSPQRSPGEGQNVQELINPLTVELLNVKRKLGELAEKVEALESVVTTKPSGALQQERQDIRRDERKEERRVTQQEQRKGAIDYLREQGVIFESKLTNLKNPDAFFEKLESQGAKIFWIAEERIAVDPTFFQNFVNRLAQIHTSDDAEAQKYLSKQEHELFVKLRKSGSIYFDNESKHWKLVTD
ncbi:hypothetical protein MetMK1DRAFT_00020760 [Metallosphaera yellowstonensis MK1]|jgi:hypothetical protein|uniref:Uncharacterized protein n=2 Tax=Metallosphaera TaxID=41980 RepID=H2C699_9CREN|nr:hypothetical protein MetMK1DRAFT_00020760 [Metallosphaera yellowstonensis MK1]